MFRLKLALLFSIIAMPAFAGQPVTIVDKANQNAAFVDSSGNLHVTVGGAGSSVTAVITGPLGTQTSAASVATTINGTLPAFASPPSVNATIVSPLGAAAPSAGASVTPDTTTGTNLASLVTNTGPSTIAVTGALATSKVVTSAPGSLKDFEVQADSTLSATTWYILILNAIVDPGNGAVAPQKCYTMPAGSQSYSGAFVNPPAFSVGIVIVVSTTGCFTETQSAHAFISGDF